VEERLTTNQEVPGSKPGMLDLFFFDFFFLLRGHIVQTESSLRIAGSTPAMIEYFLFIPFFLIFYN
jgi:hypothetical protein